MKTSEWSLSGWRQVCDRLFAYGRKSMMGQFLAWWWRELVGSMPASLKRKFLEGQERRVVRWPLSDDVEGTSGRPVLLLLEPAQVLACDLCLPYLPRNSLGKVMAYEIDKYSPFVVEQAYFAVRVKERLKPDLIRVELFVIGRSQLDSIIELIQAKGVAVAGVDVQRADGRPQGIDLLPISPRMRRDRCVKRMRIGLIASIFALALACLSAWVERGERALEIRRTQLAELRVVAKKVEGMRQKLRARDEMERALSLRESQRITSVAFLDMMTRCIPELTWLDAMRIDPDGGVRISGSSDRASDLPAQLSTCASLRQASLEGEIQLEPQTQRERFTLRAQLPEGMQ
ncbi:PilN domain-containing protein [Achromobacter seleniivolatilans]|uniref:PilN domain-containing protein n=1 Tax=Achromobacter seleniivolatilans TaxID=3047478 RepID=A0ABY9LZP3_9BURK|nr:PilN domain-containing protein [Achromobacter sp. R39]WMD20206.1 PilN domain-containing protein [Achromobacter sp. R39]